jgi:hypothetical protein
MTLSPVGVEVKSVCVCVCACVCVWRIIPLAFTLTQLGS